MPYKITTNKTWDETLRDLDETFDKWRVTTWSVTPTRPGKANAGGPVTVTFTKRRGDAPISLTLNSQPTLRHNLRALALAIEDMRMVEVRGLESVYKQAYSTQLAAPAQTAPTRNPYTVLGVKPNAAWGDIETRYRQLAKLYHPDVGGNQATMQELNAAYAAIKKERGG